MRVTTRATRSSKERTDELWGNRAGAGIVHEDDEVIAVGLERLAHAGQQPEMGRELPERFDEAHHRHPLHAVQHGGPRGLEGGAAERLEPSAREAAAQRRHDRGGVRVP